jgi:hypothetical protein
MMKLVPLILSLAAVSATASARNNDIAADLASAGYAPSIALELDNQAKPAALPRTTINVSCATARQITADLASAGYGPAGVTSAAAAGEAARASQPRTQVDYRITDALRADLTSAGYAPSIGSEGITVSRNG